MEYRRLGNTGLRVSALSLGGWLTFGERIDQETTNAIIRAAVDKGVNLIDLADVYALGKAELAAGACIGPFKRSDLVISTKVFWPMSSDPNDRGLSRKHIMESVDKSLQRLRTDYLDLYFCHRADKDTPLEETIRAMDDLVRRGKVLYWGTSVWDPDTICRAHCIARYNRWQPPVVEQPQYSLLTRDIERSLLPTAARFGMGLTVWSPLAGGILTGKYLGGIPEQSRGQTTPRFVREDEVEKTTAQIRRFCEIAAKLGCQPAQLAIAWLLRRPFLSSVILGATSVDQLLQNLASTTIKIPGDVLAEISRLFPAPRWDLRDAWRLVPHLARPRVLRKLLS
jgi:voltage-dependent potassium channel beta subunit